MVSAARQKIDSNTRSLFDPEVDRPEHDQILQELFSTHQLQELLAQLHNLKPLSAIDENSRFNVVQIDGPTQRRIVLGAQGLEGASALAGGPPSWKSLSPIRITRKTVERPLDYSSNGKSSRLIGFVDICVWYDVVQSLDLLKTESGHKWDLDCTSHMTLIEVKSAWPTAGNLLRQLNLYWWSRPDPASYQSGPQPHLIAVGPDASMAGLLHEHGYRLATFDPFGKIFSVVPRPKVASKTANEKNVF